MNGKQYDAILESLSRRKFLRTGSAALAMTALAGATALGQERPNTKAAEHDHSSNDPGQGKQTTLG
jgi:oxalate decarboxylase